MNQAEQPHDEQPKPAKNKRKRKWFFLISFVLLAVFLYFIWWVYFGGVPIVISYQTTRITEPVDEEGYVDYLVYLNQQASKGVTPENNFEYIYRKLIGVDDIDEKIRKEYLDILGLKEEDILDGNKRFQGVFQFLDSKLIPKDHDYVEYTKAQIKINAIYDSVMIPWTEQDAPLVAEWLKKNSHHLDFLEQEINRPKFYTPYLKIKNNVSDIITLNDISIYSSYEIRSLLNSYRIRAMYRISNHQIEEAFDDLSAAHRLANLIENNFCFDTEYQLANGCASGVISADLIILGEDRITRNQLLSYLSFLKSVEHPPSLTKRMDTRFRFSFLDDIQAMTRTRTDKESTSERFVFRFLQRQNDYNSVMKWTNQEFDTMNELFTLKNPVKIIKELNDQSQRIHSKMSNAKSGLMNEFYEYLGSKVIRFQESEWQCFSMFSMYNLSAVDNVLSEFSLTFKQDATRIAFALKAWQLDHESYPDKLDLLVPDYLPEIPLDPFSGKQPVYKLTEDGFLIYSVGLNQKDENGYGERGLIRNQTIEGDDITIQFPYLDQHAN